MADRITSEQRSRNMSAVRSSGNATTELALAGLFRKDGITGWRRHQKVFGIKPDFTFQKKRIAVFVHGCFWHECKKHRATPKTNRSFWTKKIEGNKTRDARSAAVLKRKGWGVIQVWEHEIKSIPSKAIGKFVISKLKSL